MGHLGANSVAPSVTLERVSRQNIGQHPKRESSSDEVDAGRRGIPERGQRKADEREYEQDQG